MEGVGFAGGIGIAHVEESPGDLVENLFEAGVGFLVVGGLGEGVVELLDLGLIHLVTDLADDGVQAGDGQYKSLRRWRFRRLTNRSYRRFR